jgi:hypothetical protein
MVEEWVVTLGFNKDNPRNSLAPSGQQSWGEPTKAIPPKAKGAKLDSGGGFTFLLMEQGGKNKW